MTTQISDIQLFDDKQYGLSLFDTKAILNDSDITTDINDYFFTKKAYYEFIASYKPRQKFSTSINSVSTNFPLRFYESRNSLILEIIDPTNLSPVFRKSINVEPFVNLESELYNLRKLLGKQKLVYNKYITYDKINKLKEEKYSLEISLENNKISKEVFSNKIRDLDLKCREIKEQYDTFRLNFNDIVEKFTIIVNNIKSSYNKNLDKFNSQNISLVTYKILVNKLNKEIISHKNLNREQVDLVLLLRQYKFISNILYSKNNLKKNSIVVKKQEYNQQGNTLKLDYIYNVVSEKGDEILICEDIGGTIEEINKSELLALKSVNNFINDFYVDMTKNMKLIDDNQIIGTIDIDNIGGEDSYETDDSIIYFSHKPNIKIKTKRKVTKKIIPLNITNGHPKDDTLDLDTILVIGTNSLTKPFPGKGLNEKISSEEFKNNSYSNLNRVKKWRHILSNNYIHKVNNKIIRTIVIDGEKFSSVGHYRLFIKFSKNKLLADSFKFSGKFGQITPVLLQKKGNSDDIIDDWNDIEHEILVKANYAKFNQLEILKEALVNTNNALIITEDIEQIHTYKYSNELMHTRKLINQEALPDNYSLDSARDDKSVFTQSILSSEKSSLDLPEQGDTSSIPVYRLPILQFYSKSKSEPLPGEGNGEYIDPVDKPKFISLNKFTDWRKMLSNFWEQEFSLNNKRWLSVEHYYQASKFINKNKDYYDKFSLNSGSELSKSSLKAQKAGIKNSKTRPEHIKMDSDFTISGRDKKVMFDAMYAKFSQNEYLTNMLLSTHNALLYHFSRGKSPILFKELMDVRDTLLVEKLDKLGLTDGKKLIKISQKFSVGGDDKPKIFNKGSLFLLEEGPRIIYNLSDNSIVGKLPVSFTNWEEIVKKISTSMTPPEKEKRQTPPVKKSLYQKQLESAKVILTKIGYNQTKLSALSNTDIVTLAAKLNSLNDGYFKAFDDLADIIKNQYKDYSIMEVPPDGDCLYYSVIQLLEKENIFPMNFTDGHEEGQFSRKTKELLLVAGNTNVKGPIFVEASNQLRLMVSNKLRDNLEVESDEIVAIKAAIGEDKETYLNGIKNSASPLNEGAKGEWGGDLEIKLISALFNIKITSILSDGSKRVYLPEANRTLFPEGSRLNDSMKNKQIFLGYLQGGNHYLGIYKKEEVDKSAAAILEEMQVYEPLNNYFYKSVERDGIVYNIAYMKEQQSDSYEIRGFYDNTSKKITYDEDIEEGTELDIVLSDIIDSTSEDIDLELLTKINYFKNLEDDTIYIDGVNGKKTKVGLLVIDEESEGDIPDKKIKFD